MCVCVTGCAFSGGVRSMQIFMSFLFLLLFIDTLQGLGMGKRVCWDFAEQHKLEVNKGRVWISRVFF